MYQNIALIYNLSLKWKDSSGENAAAALYSSFLFLHPALKEFALDKLIDPAFLFLHEHSQTNDNPNPS
jgi:hypothetical protein